MSGCITPDFDNAEPEKYMGFDCEQLDQLAETYRDTPQDLLARENVSEMERRNENSQSNSQRGNVGSYLAKQRRDQRSIALARRKKGCI